LGRGEQHAILVKGQSRDSENSGRVAYDSNGSSDLVYQGERSVVGGITITMSTKPAVKSTRIRGAGSQRRPANQNQKHFHQIGLRSQNRH
jgi:hypothetical protein